MKWIKLLVVGYYDRRRETMVGLYLLPCVYAQQGYAFGRVHLFMCACLYVCICGQKKRLFVVLPLGNLPLM